MLQFLRRLRPTRQFTVGWIVLSAACSADASGTYDPEAPPPGKAGLIAFAAAVHRADADGATQIKLTATLDQAVQLVRPYVAFSTTAGSLVPGGTSIATVTPDIGGSAIVVLVAPSAPGVAYLRAGADTTVRTDSVVFVRALPSRINLEPKRFTLISDTLATSQDDTLIVTLTRDVGVVTAGTLVSFSATTTIGPPAVFAGVSTSNAAGVVTMRYSPGLTKYRGPVTITATTTGQDGSPLVAQTTVQIIAPLASKTGAIQLPALSTISGGTP